jgi:hypothetical protein
VSRVREGDHAADPEADQRDVLLLDQRRTAEDQMACRQRDHDGDHRNRQRGNEQLVAKAFGARLAGFQRQHFGFGRCHAAEPGDQRHHDHQQADYRGRQQVADQKHQRVQNPETAGGEATGMFLVGEDHAADHEQHDAYQPEQVVDGERHA